MSHHRHHQPVELQSLLHSFDEDMAQAPKHENGTVLDHDDTNDNANRSRSVASVVLHGATDPVYEGKALVLNEAIQEIGMGWYQWQLFVVVGFGWASDNLWPIVVSLILNPIDAEFRPRQLPLLTLCQALGLLVGAMFWGFGCDIFGRRIAFNLTIAITSIFGLAAAGAPSFAAIGIFVTFWSVGVGGNLPVGKWYPCRSSKRRLTILTDSAIFLEFLPGTHQYLLTILSIFWAFAQVIATLVAWPLLGHRTCQKTDQNCTRAKNFGWRYYMLAMGGLALMMFIARFVFFTLYESPKYLMGRGKDEEAVRVVHEVARRNGKTSRLTLADLQAFDREGNVDTGAKAMLTRKLQKVNLSHVRALFATPKLAYSTSLIMVIWGLIGLGFPLYNAFLPYIQESRGVDFGDGSTYITYRNALIIAVIGVPGALTGGAMVELPRFGRKGTLGLATALTGVFLFASTRALTSNALLGWNCAYNFMANIMYAVLYAYTPEIFLTKDRGTGNALTATANRIFGIMSPIIAMYADIKTAVPVYVSGALFIAAGLLTLILPYESQGKASL